MRETTVNKTAAVGASLHAAATAAQLAAAQMRQMGKPQLALLRLRRMAMAYSLPAEGGGLLWMTPMTIRLREALGRHYAHPR